MSRAYEKRRAGLIQVKQMKVHHQCEAKNCFGENTAQHVRRLVRAHVLLLKSLLKWFNARFGFFNLSYKSRHIACLDTN